MLLAADGRPYFLTEYPPGWVESETGFWIGGVRAYDADGRECWISGERIRRIWMT